MGGKAQVGLMALSSRKTWLGRKPPCSTSKAGNQGLKVSSSCTTHHTRTHSISRDAVRGKSGEMMLQGRMVVVRLGLPAAASSQPTCVASLHLQAR